MLLILLHIGTAVIVTAIATATVAAITTITYTAVAITVTEIYCTLTSIQQRNNVRLL